ncbi:efflux RND transporter permease subunit [Acuticoccus sp. M5D2P5]|uniref:efflux RND transporter permease subunit n=1 Tax=Acuticoccus kalidii TaxID=2910977 RepID=UPI001F3F9553|nr:multidrug efflux RND transporter permease subunit [Acuticoccus kalidii]MCF3934906.1 efflux RND transporter permease subunit [Acuticoccus kalidii]
MSLSHFFIDRPIFATVVSLLIVILGGLAYTQLPVAQYPEIAPPTIVVRASYPGADADTIARTVATPIEEEVNGVEDMLYMSSYSTADGSMALTITFRLGTDLDQAQVLVQNRVAIAEPRLPEEVRRLGITTLKSSPDLMMVVHMLSPDDTYDQLYISNYARSRVRDILTRLDGVGDLIIFGERRYAMRIWLNPERLSAYGMTASDVVQALREQNVQVSGGTVGAPPEPDGNAFQLAVTTQGRFDEARDFRYVIVKDTEDGRLIQLQDIARIELGAQDYVTNSYLNNQPAVALAIFQRPGTNALDAAEEIQSTMRTLAADFPPGLEYSIVYNPTEYIAESVYEVYKTIVEAMLLVILVVVVFLQSWRTAIIPIIAIPVSLIGTFAVMLAFGYSLNLLTLFGLVLAIGIVVDDAIVVVENVERNIDEGLDPRAASHRTMNEVGSAVIAITLVLVAVFVPTAFIPGITGQFYQQFAVTIAAATALSGLNSLTLSPALAALFLKSRHEHREPRGIGRIGAALAGGFNRGFDLLARGYGAMVRFFVSGAVMLTIMVGGFVALLFATWWMLTTTPQGFIPEQDQGYAIVVLKLPDGASLSRTDAVTREASDIIKATPGVKDAVAFAGFSAATFTNQSDSAAIFAGFQPFEERLKEGHGATEIIGALYARLQSIEEAFIIAVPPPSVPGIGNQGGFKIQLQDRDGADVDRVLASAYEAMNVAAESPGLAGVFTTFSASSPQIYLDIERDKARMLNVPIPNIFDALSTNFGTAYVNDFNAFGRVFQVRAQADAPFRASVKDLLRLKVRAESGALVPLGTVMSVREEAGPALVQRYNMYVSVPLQGNAAPGTSTGDALDAMERAVQEVAPAGISYEWTELAFQERSTGDSAVLIFGLAVLFAFLAMAALYESWVLPIAIILIVPLSILAALIGVNLRGLDNNVLTQVGLVVLVGLAAKNAILIVEFARQGEAEGKSLIEATVDACRLRLRPILMTAFAFILGVVPLMLAEGPGAEMRVSLGTAVFSGMLGVTIFGLFFTPVFYVALRRLTGVRPFPSDHAVATEPTT